MSELLLLLISALLILACGLFVAAEFAFITVDRSSVERAAKSGDRQAAGLRAALRHLSTQLAGAQLGITVTNLAIGFLAEPAIASLLHGPLTSIGLPSGAADTIAVTVALLIATALTMIYGELVPKNLAIAKPMTVARRVQRWQRIFTRAVAWPIRLLDGTANLILGWFGIEAQEELASARSAEELLSLLQRSAAQGTLATDTADLLQRSLGFGEKRAGDVLTPRVDMQVVARSAPVADVIALTIRTGHSRFPVTGDGPDDIVGLVHVKHAVAVADAERGRVPVGDVMVSVPQVPSSLPLDPLLESMRAGGLQMAVVVDEYGGVDGLVTIEDLIEELVGDVTDEHDPLSAPAWQRADGAWVLSGQLRPDEIFDLTGVRIPEGRGYETVAGLIAKELGRIPGVGDEVDLPAGDVAAARSSDSSGTSDTSAEAFRLSVLQVVGRRVDQVLLTPADPDAESAGHRPTGEAS
ncbi:CBS domain containing-hemolysin-like protein [Jatrophihabitans sp. GAS493]|uniref:hemolysin family protein n=1 Tax=Jatrophihabitans sp. GAS493 TaxID=1907575 RepID=UPI000BB687B8|nr:hemolysin family protein [Jatrophihabitans sp. GAS493]SOD71431.1 CBS domain containing-hemolysin-like protein [Jatrophihabitans sp. GAS493]